MNKRMRGGAAALSLAGVATAGVLLASPSSAAAVSTTTAAGAARAADPGVVDIVATLQDGEAAGTGMVLTSSGLVLTNNHVIEGATSLRVRDVGNGRTYRATVVGYDRTADIAVLRLTGASNLATVKVATTAPRVGSAVVAVGNAGGGGGTPVYARGTVVAKARAITASDDSGANAERLTGLIETDADVQPGDSGGPLVNLAGRVVGMDTAAGTSYSATGRGYTASAEGYAIPIARALEVARQIDTGSASSTVHIGATAALGVYVASDPADGFGYAVVPGVFVEGAVAGGGAAQAGLAAGDTITGVAGRDVTGTTTLSTIVGRLRPGSRVWVRYLDADGEQHTVKVTTGTGVPQ